MLVFSPVLLFPALVSGVVVGVFARSHDPVRVGRLATLAGIACLVVPVIVLYQVRGW